MDDVYGTRKRKNEQQLDIPLKKQRLDWPELKKWPELEAWNDWTLETCRAYVDFLCLILPEKCMPQSPTWCIMEFVGSAPWWILTKILKPSIQKDKKDKKQDKQDTTSMGNFWSGNGDLIEPARLYHAATNYLSSILHARPDLYLYCGEWREKASPDRTSMTAIDENVNFMLKYCRIRERAVKVYDHSRIPTTNRNPYDIIHNHDSNIRFLHFGHISGTCWSTTFSHEVLQVTPRLIVVSLSCYWSDLLKDIYRQTIRDFASIAPIVFVNVEMDLKSFDLNIIIQDIFKHQLPHSILVIRDLEEGHNVNGPYLKLLVDEPLRKYLYYNMF
jgi:hypothetical protein